MKKLTRKEFLRISALAGSTALLPGTMASNVSLGSFMADYEVIIIGAGLAGLTAARDLQAAGVSNILVLEANDRVGGRTLNQDTGACYIAEGGGQWIGPTQTAIQDIMSELGIGQYPTYLEGEGVGLEALSANQQEAFDAAVVELESMADTLSLSEPWNAASADTWDAMTLETWMDGYFDFDQLPAYFQMYFGVFAFLGNPGELSLLYFLFYVKSAGSFYDLDFGAQQIRISGGSQSISTTIADNLGSVVQLESPVEEIQDDGAEVTVISNGNSYTAEKVIIAMSPKDVGNIVFTPELPADRQALNQNWNMSAGWKASLIYETPFWRDAGFSGQISNGEIFISFDNSDEAGDCGILVIFPDTSVEALATAEEREQALKNSVETAFGPEAQNNLGYTEKNWSEENFISGCVSPVTTGVLTSYGPTLREPIGNIHFAGTETSEIWTGYMDGAIRSGHRVADECLSSGVGESAQLHVHVYPNPVSDKLKVVLPPTWNISHVVLNDSKGSDVLSKQVNAPGLLELELGDTAPGIYTLSIFQDEQKLTARKVLVR